VGDEFPSIVREAWRRGAYLVFLDESGFMLTPTVCRTLAPRGKTPVQSAWESAERTVEKNRVSIPTAHGTRMVGRPERGSVFPFPWHS
jgi:hypothetical protein